MQYKKYLLVVVLCCFTIIGRSQNNSVKVSGTVKSQSGEPIGFANISLKNTNYGAFTDENGNYVFVAPLGNHTLHVSFMGCNSIEKAVDLKEGSNLIEHFILHEISNNLDEIIVRGKSKSRKTKEQPLSVNAIELKQLSNTTLNLGEVLNKSTGVKIREKGGVGSDFEFSINGLSGKAVRFFIDGIPLDVLGNSMSLNNIPINIAERVVVYKGVVPVHLGSDALGGAVNIITNKNVFDYLDTSYSLGSFNTHRLSLIGQHNDKKAGLVVKASGFINYSDNNYTMYNVRTVKVIDKDNSKFVTGNFKRFHDQYKTVLGQFEIGLVNKTWADVFFLGSSFSGTYKEIQTGNNQDMVFGGIDKRSNAHSTMLKYSKKNLFDKKLDLNVLASISENRYVVTDTLYRRYYWDGFYQEKPNSEFGARSSIFHVKRPKKFLRSNLSYKLAQQHSLGTNYTLDNVKNYNWDELDVDEDDAPGQLTKHNIGLSYQQNFWSKALINTFFTKYYGIHLDKPFALQQGSQGERAVLSQWNDYIGYGIGSRYSFKEKLGIKASYEKAYRLQEVIELFGNGYTIIANNELQPESSHNFNLGVFYGANWKKNNIFFETNGFLRNAKNFIAPVVYLSNSQIISYENTSKVLVRGVDAEMKYKYADLLNVTANATYQKTIDNSQFPHGSNIGTESATYKNQLPNRPWLFGNLTLGLGKSNLFNSKDNRLQFNWGFQYVHWYYLTWENYGNKDNINTVPSQYIQNTSLSYSFNDGKYNIAIEGKNITNQLAYDNFKLQKPGRGFSVKLRYFIK